MPAPTNMLEVFTIVESDDPNRKNRWTKIGVAFRNRDGSINVHLDAVPINGKLHIREPNRDQQ